MDEQKNIPVDANDTPDLSGNGNSPTTPPNDVRSEDDMAENIRPGRDDMDDRLERLGGEPAPVITPEEFARLQKAGQVHIDSRGRVKTTRRSDAEAGVSLRKRRAWYDF